MMKKFHLTKDNEVSMRKSLIEQGVSPTIVDNLDFGYYTLNEVGVRKISQSEYLILQSKELLPGATAVVLGGTKICFTNHQLNTEKYNEVNKSGKPSGHGFAFEDINNRRFHKEGYKIDSIIGKTCEKGGIDAVCTDRNGKSFNVQYKCTSIAELAANKIEKEKGYPDQILYVNTEIVDDLRRALKNKEAEGKVPLGTSSKVIDSGVTLKQAKRVARFGTKESLIFDSETAIPTFIVTSLAVGAVAFVCNLKEEGEINTNVIKNTLKKAAKWGLILACVHIVINQIKRL